MIEQETKKSPDFGHPSKQILGGVDYYKQFTPGSSNTFAVEFFDKVFRKSFIIHDDGSYEVSESRFYKASQQFFESVFTKISIHPDFNRCLTATIHYKNPDGLDATADRVAIENDENDFIDFADAAATEEVCDPNVGNGALFNHALSEIRKRQPSDDGVDLNALGLDKKEVNRICDVLEKDYPEDKIDIAGLHKCGELHVPKDFFENNNQQEKK